MADWASEPIIVRATGRATFTSSDTSARTIVTPASCKRPNAASTTRSTSGSRSVRKKSATPIRTPFRSKLGSGDISPVTTESNDAKSSTVRASGPAWSNLLSVSGTHTIIRIPAVGRSQAADTTHRRRDADQEPSVSSPIARGAILVDGNRRSTATATRNMCGVIWIVDGAKGRIVACPPKRQFVEVGLAHHDCTGFQQRP